MAKERKAWSLQDVVFANAFGFLMTLSTRKVNSAAAGPTPMAVRNNSALQLFPLLSPNCPPGATGPLGEKQLPSFALGSVDGLECPRLLESPYREMWIRNRVSQQYYDLYKRLGFPFATYAIHSKDRWLC